MGSSYRREIFDTLKNEVMVRASDAEIAVKESNGYGMEFTVKRPNAFLSVWLLPTEPTFQLNACLGLSGSVNGVSFTTSEHDRLRVMATARSFPNASEAAGWL